MLHYDFANDSDFFPSSLALAMKRKTFLLIHVMPRQKREMVGGFSHFFHHNFKEFFEIYKNHKKVAIFLIKNNFNITLRVVSEV